MSERTKHHPDTCTCMWCAKELRAALAQCQRDLAACAESRATALRESAEVIAQRDTALGLCKQLESELSERASMGSLQDMAAKLNDAEYGLARVTAQARATICEWEERFDAERAAHAETRKALEEAETGWHEQRERAQDLEQQCGVLLEDLPNARAARAVAESAAAGLVPLLESTRAELAKAEVYRVQAEARVKGADRLFTAALFYRPTPEWADDVRGWMKELQGG